eukprot:scaffold7340_cov266-Pinguiococcus_pyrenoidosus.AAC.5
MLPELPMRRMVLSMSDPDVSSDSADSPTLRLNPRRRHARGHIALEIVRPRETERLAAPSPIPSFGTCPLPGARGGWISLSFQIVGALGAGVLPISLKLRPRCREVQLPRGAPRPQSKHLYRLRTLRSGRGLPTHLLHSLLEQLAEQFLALGRCRRPRAPLDHLQDNENGHPLLRTEGSAVVNGDVHHPVSTVSNRNVRGRAGEIGGRDHPQATPQEAGTIPARNVIQLFAHGHERIHQPRGQLSRRGRALPLAWYESAVRRFVRAAACRLRSGPVAIHRLDHAQELGLLAGSARLLQNRFCLRGLAAQDARERHERGHRGRPLEEVIGGLLANSYPLVGHLAARLDLAHKV